MLQHVFYSFLGSLINLGGLLCLFLPGVMKPTGSLSLQMLGQEAHFHQKLASEDGSFREEAG